jgi:hypothetical protein
MCGVLIPIRFIERTQRKVWAVTVIVVTLIIGTRYEVGGDWQSFFEVSQYYVGKGVHVSLSHEDPLYGLLNWISVKIGLGIYGVNTVCGALFVTGLAVFCRRQPIPWLAWLVGTPYLLVVVGMGYTRQSAALGFLLLGLVCLEDKRVWRYFLLLVIGAAFHKTVLLGAPLAILVWRGNIWLKVAIAIVFSGTSWVMFSDYIVRLLQGYSRSGVYESIGASYRVWMNAVPAVLFLLLRKKWVKYFDNPSLWVWIAIASIISVFLVGYASTAVDRINIYLAPIQLYFWSRLPLLVSDRLTRTLIVTATIFFYGFMFLIWLELAENAGNWIPYKSIISFDLMDLLLG